MKYLHFTWLFLLIWITESEGNINGSLKIQVSLLNGSYLNGTRNILLSCKVENAKIYIWYRNRENIISEKNYEVNHNTLRIKHFKPEYVGVYECDGEDDNGHHGRSTAFITIKDRSCGPQQDIESECVMFTNEKCPSIKSFAPKPEDLSVQIKIHKLNHFDYEAVLEITWKVPKQGVTKETLWAWQVRVFGLENTRHSRQCYQINRKDILNSKIEVENKTVVLPGVFAIYLVEVQGLPSLAEPHAQTVAKKIIKVPDWCTLHGSLYPCCDYFEGSYHYMNASLVVDNNETTIFWSTRFSPNMNISIKGYILKWVSHPDDRCHADAVELVDPHVSSYIFSNLKKYCGNYSLTVEVKFMYPYRVGCDVSPGVTLVHNPSPQVTRTPYIVPKPDPKNAFMTVGLSIAASVIAILIIALFVISRRRRKGHHNSDLNVRLVPLNNNEVKVFILNPNHCNLCNDVVHKLASLLIATGHIACEVDMFVPNNQKAQGPLKWNEMMIKENQYVLIPWLTPYNTSGTSVNRDMNVNTFALLLETIRGERLLNPHGRSKFIPVYLDHSTIEIIPPHQRLLHTYQIPSNIDSLIMELIGETVRQRDGSILQFNDQEYIDGKEKLKIVVDKTKGHHCNNCFH